MHHSNQVRLSGRGVGQSMLSSCTVEGLASSIRLPPAVQSTLPDAAMNMLCSLNAMLDEAV